MSKSFLMNDFLESFLQNKHCAKSIPKTIKILNFFFPEQILATKK